MLYLSSYLGRPVLDAGSRRVGTVRDLTARLNGPYPAVMALRVRTGRHSHIDLSWNDVRSFETSQIILAANLQDLDPYVLGDQDVLLSRNVLDKQIVDLEGRRLIRVQDVQLSRTGTQLRVLGVDVSTSALLRRLRLRRLADRVAAGYPPHAVAWEDVDLGSWRDPNVRLRVARTGLRRLHPADLAEIAAALPPGEGAGLLAGLEDEVAADTLEEMSPEVQVRMLEALGPERAVQLLEEMSPDDAADLLQDLPREEAEALLARMDPKEAEDIHELLGYEEESAGGLMTTEVFSVLADETAQGLIERLRARAPDEEAAYYLYVVDEAERLVGVMSLRDLVVAPGEARVAAFMRADPISVRADEDKKEVVEAIMKYNLLALPVVDDQERLVGVVTVDDVIDLVGPRSWRPDSRRFLRR
ncbi:MAG: CBS domain-containing protein [Actinomycetota bacterium]